MDVEKYISGLEPLPKLGTVKRREARQTLLQERDKLMTEVERLVIKEGRRPSDRTADALSRRIKTIERILGYS